MPILRGDELLTLGLAARYLKSLWFKVGWNFLCEKALNVNFFTFLTNRVNLFRTTLRWNIRKRFLWHHKAISYFPSRVKKRNLCTHQKEFFHPYQNIDEKKEEMRGGWGDEKKAKRKKNWKLILLCEWWQKSINGMKFAYKDVEDEMLNKSERRQKKHFSDFFLKKAPTSKYCVKYWKWNSYWGVGRLFFIQKYFFLYY